MKNILMTCAAIAVSIGGAAIAEGDLSRANIIDVTVLLGSDDDGMFIRPSMGCSSDPRSILL